MNGNVWDLLQEPCSESSALFIDMMLENYSNLFFVGKDSLFEEYLPHSRYLSALYICKLSEISRDYHK